MRHAFGYSLYYAYLDLAELPALCGPGGVLTRLAPLVRFEPRDQQLGDDLDTAVRRLVRRQTGLELAGPLRVLTQLRCWGVRFSPLDLFFCFDETGRDVIAVVAAVTNTPWLERHHYVLWAGNQTGRGRYRHAKDFHVSPFMDLAWSYHWRLSPPGERLRGAIVSRSAAEQPFVASFDLERRSLTVRELAVTLLRFPWMPLQILAAIYFEALRLWWKRCRYYPHPRRSNQPLATEPASPPTPETPTTALPASRVATLDRWLHARLERRLGQVREGRLDVTSPLGARHFVGAEAGLAAELHVADVRLARRLALGGSLAAAEAYLDGWWSTPDLTTLLRWFARNPHLLAGSESLSTWLVEPLRRLAHGLRSNTRRGSRANIAAHYDLGDEFFALLLDPTMTYSCGVFPHAEATLEQASCEKYDRLCRKLALHPDDHVLEIGSGWGGFALHAASRYGCRVTTTTISRRQFEFARQRIDAAGLAARVTLLKHDYRDLTGQFDKLASIEMIEAVGHRFLPTYFGQCSRLLKPNGLFALQAITMPEQRYRRYLRSVDYIRRHVFPGGSLPSQGAMLAAVRDATDLRLTHLEELSDHYARTLAAWRDRLNANEAAARQWGLDDRGLRAWRYYLAYCEAGFLERQIGVAQLVFEKPGCRRPNLLGAM